MRWAPTPPELALAAAGLLCGAGAGHAQADLSLGEEAAMPGEFARVALTVASNPGATALQADLLFDSARLVAGAPQLGPGLPEHELETAAPQAGVFRLLVYSPTNAALPAGEIASVRFRARAAATPGPAPIDPSAAEVATAAATAVLPLTLGSGSVHIFTVQADLAVGLTAGPRLVADGDPLGFTLVAVNRGPDAVDSIEISEPAPAELTAVTWACSPAGGASCSAAGAGDVDDTVDLPAGGSATYLMTGTVDTTATFIDNTAMLTPPPEAFDASTGDHVDSAVVDVCSENDVVLSGFDIGGEASFNACVTLTAGPAFNVQDTGLVELVALGSVVLANGFTVESGGQVTIDTP